MRFRKKPQIVEPEQFTHVGPPAALPRGVYFRVDGNGVPTFYVVTIHGQETTVVAGDWIMPEPDGVHFYPCKDDGGKPLGYEPV